MKKLNAYKNSAGDLELKYPIDEEGNLEDEPIKCVMCEKMAFFIAKETNEALCEKCYKINLGIRKSK